MKIIRKNGRYVLYSTIMEELEKDGNVWKNTFKMVFLREMFYLLCFLIQISHHNYYISYLQQVHYFLIYICSLPQHGQNKFFPIQFSLITLIFCVLLLYFSPNVSSKYKFIKIQSTLFPNLYWGQQQIFFYQLYFQVTI